MFAERLLICLAILCVTAGYNGFLLFSKQIHHTEGIYAKHHHFSRPVIPQIQAEKTQTHFLGITTQAKHHNFRLIKALNTKHIGNNNTC